MTLLYVSFIYNFGRPEYIYNFAYNICSISLFPWPGFAKNIILISFLSYFDETTKYAEMTICTTQGCIHSAAALLSHSQ